MAEYESTPIRADLYSRIQKLQEEGEIVTGFVVVYEKYDTDTDKKSIHFMHGDGSGEALYPWTITALLDWTAAFIKKQALS